MTKIVSFAGVRAGLARSQEGRSAAYERARWAIRAKAYAVAALTVDRRSAYRGAARKVQDIARTKLRDLPEIAALAALLHTRAEICDAKPSRRRGQTMSAIMAAVADLSALQYLDEQEARDT